jgi:hypothetical protein
MWTEVFRAILVACVMGIFGILGSYCRKIWEKDETERARSKVMFPGVAAAFVVPLFLSVGDSGIFKDALAGGTDFWHNLFVIAGFCILAGVSAPTFINALAQRALRIAEEAKEEAKTRSESVENKVEAVSEVIENSPDAAPPVETPFDLRLSMEAMAPDLKSSFAPSSAEAKLFAAFGRSGFTKRTIGGLAKDTELDRTSVKLALSELVKQAIVEETVSQKTGSSLYSLRTRTGS